MRFSILVASLILSAAASAAPSLESPPVDELQTVMVDKGLIGKLDSVRQVVTNSTSALVGNALGFIGVPYRRGGNTAETGFDCSGFVRAMYNQTVGLMLPRRAVEQAAATQPVASADMKPGDLVFFNTMRRAFSHVGIYIGEGKFIHSPRPGAQVRIDSMSGSYWQRRFEGARRVEEAQDQANVPELSPPLR